MRNFVLFMSFLAYVILTRYLVELHFNHFGPYRMLPGTWAVDWRGITYLLSSAFFTALLLNLLFIFFAKPPRTRDLILAGLLCDAFFFLHQTVQLGLHSPLSSIENRPLHQLLVNLVLFAMPLASYVVARTTMKVLAGKDVARNGYF